MSLYIGVYTVLYSYEAQTEEELSVEPNDILYLLEKSEVDDWWKVKKRILPVGDEEVDEPVGLVPSNYIEPAPTVKTCSALYDYTKQTEEELTFKEGDQFNVYDLNDPDWLLVGDSATGLQFGFIPSNYVQLNDQSSAPAAITPAASVPISNFAPPPQHISRQVSEEPKIEPKMQEPQDLDVEPEEYEEEEPEPALPSRPRPTQVSNNYEDDAPPPAMPNRPRGDLEVSRYEDEEEEELGGSSAPQHSFDGEFFKWFIDEIDGRKKRPVVLAIGQGKIILKPNQSSPRKLLKRTASTLDNEWRIKDLINFNNEKKHVFLDFKNPKESIELHCGSKDVSDAIMSILGDLKGAESAKGLKEVARASQPSKNASNKKIGRLLYTFKAQGSDELNCREGDEVYILDKTKSADWWLCENIDTGRQGVVPSSYIEIVGSSNLDKLTEAPTRLKSQKAKDKKSSKSSRHRDRDERDRIREKDRIEREKTSSKRVDSNDKSMPNYHRVRTWIDSSGSFKVEAEFLGCIEGKIHLHKTNGVKIAVSATKLSIEDLEYVEKVTGSSLETYKEEVSKQITKRKAAMEKKNGVSKSEHESKPHPPSPTSKPKSAMAAINDIPPAQPARPKSSTQSNEPDYDWFDFFLNCGVDIGNCQRYSLNFSREQMDENILEDITPSLLRTLGLREGDIIRVMKYLDTKFNRSKTDEPTTAASGSLFTEPTGALKNNSSSEVSKVDAKALPSHAQSTEPKKIEDDAWAIKPASRSSEDLSKPSQPVQPQYTGSLQDLVNIKPIELTTGSNVNKPMPALPAQNNTEPSAPSLTPVKTGSLIQPGQQFTVQKTGNTNLVSPQKTGGLVPVQRTGGLVPVQRTGGLIPVVTGGFMTAQPTGFMPITAQPTGFMPIQATGMIPQFTTGGFVPLQTGATTFVAQKTGPQVAQITGGMPPVSFGQPALQTGSVTMPQTTFGQPMTMPTTSFGQPLSLQQTGPLIPVRTGPVPSQVTGGAPPTSFGFQPQSTFGQSISSPATFNGQVTGNTPQYSNPFPQQPTGGFVQQPTFGQPATSFGQQQFQPQQTFGQPAFQPQPTFGQPQQSFGQPQNTFGQQQQTFGQPQTSFGQPQNTFGQNFNNNMNQMTNMFQNTNLGQAPPTSFGQPQFEGFGSLQAQPTGSGFGNAPLQNQPTGKRANLQAATADNPFGF